MNDGTDAQKRPVSRAPSSIIRTKVSPPPLGSNVVERPRLSAHIAETIERNHTIVVAATAGSGKTTAVVQACLNGSRPVAWLTVDQADSAPGRLLLYIEAAIGVHVESVRGLVAEVLGARISHAEAAGLLVDATSEIPLTLVIDGLEHLNDSPEGLAVIEALVRYAPVSLKVVLLSRSDVPIDSRMISGVDFVAAVGEQDLAFTLEEATFVLQKMNMFDVDPAHALEVTQGWVAGILFESWRSRKNVVGVKGESDPLHGYLSSQILERLSPAQRDFLVGTSLLDEVTPARALALGQKNAADVLVSLRKEHLPVSWLEGQDAVRCHPRFREYLLALFERRSVDAVRTQRLAYGDLLMKEGHPEEAVEQYLLAGSTDKALAPAESTLGGIINRLDFAIADRWLDALVATFGAQNKHLVLPQLLLAISRENYALACNIADALKDSDSRNGFAASSPLGASIMAWSYWHLNRISDVESVIANAHHSPEMQVVNYLMTLVDHQYSDRFRNTVDMTGGPMDGLVMRVHYAHGRLIEMAQEPASPWAAAVSAPWRIGVLRASGRLTQALDVYAKTDDHGASLSWLYGIVGPELMIDLLRTEDARQALRIGRTHIRASGSIVFELLSSMIEAKLELRLESNPKRALAIIDEVERISGRSYNFINESIDLWRGLAFLQLGDLDTQALDSLSSAVSSMVRARRFIDLPTAAVYLAEAQWRNGNSDESDAATNLALATSAELGSHHQLLLALAEFEAVLSRRLDVETDVDSQWHELGRSLIGRDISSQSDSRVILQMREFGETALVIDGAAVKPRIAKSLALVSLMATAPKLTVSRAEALNVLFDGEQNDSSRAYLRQAVHRLREVMPPGLGPAFVGDQLSFSGPVSISSDSLQFENLLIEANRLQGEDKLRVLERALAIYSAGDYLPKVDSSWASDRRLYLAEKAVNANLAGAAICFEAQKYQQAMNMTRAALHLDPYIERGWRLLMRVHSALGDVDGVSATYRECEAALAEAELVPSGATKELFVQLRPL